MDDARWFKLNPERRYRVRRATPGEVAAARQRIRIPIGLCVFVVVENVVDGIRSKVMFGAEPDIELCIPDWQIETFLRGFYRDHPEAAPLRQAIEEMRSP